MLRFLLWGSYSDILPIFESRRTTNTRSAQEAETVDLLNALKVIDGSEFEFPKFCSDDYDRVPRHGPEQFDMFSLLDRVSNLEKDLRSTSSTVIQHSDSIRTLFDINTAQNVSYARRVTSPVADKSVQDPPRVQAPDADKQQNKSVPDPLRVKAPDANKQQPPKPQRQPPQRTERPRQLKSVFPRTFTMSPLRDSVPPSATVNTNNDAKTDETQSVLSEMDEFEQTREEKRRLARQKRRMAVYGNAEGSSLRGAPCRTDLFIFRLEQSTTLEEVKKYVSDKSVDVIEIECRSSDEAQYKSFRLNIDSGDLDTVMSSSFWPTGVGCRKYFHKRKLANPPGRLNDGSE
jgi:hypothetical protein